MTLSADDDIKALRAKLAQVNDPSVTPPVSAARSAQAAYGTAVPLPAGIERTPVTLGGMPTERLSPSGTRQQRAFLLLHSGGYSAGTAADHAALAAQLALAADATGYVPEYRRAPEYPFPAAVDDAIDAYRGADVYLNGADPRSPLASPVFGDFTDFPPLLVHVGTDEVLLGDAIALAPQASLAGSDVTLRVWAKMIHIFPWFHSHLQAGRTAIEEAGIWIAEVMARQ
jgi:acetyl esterase/lipase